MVESWRKKQDLQASGGAKQLKKLSKMGARGDVYCILKCEGQIKRTALARGHQNPVWKEDVAFKSVQISSELLVRFPLLLSTSTLAKSSWPSGSRKRCQCGEHCPHKYPSQILAPSSHLWPYSLGRCSPACTQ